jgi:hypothetical protein
MEGKPGDVRDAQKRGDSDALTAMGTKGGIHAGLMNADRKNQKDKDLDAFLAKQNAIFHINDEGDVLPPNPEDQKLKQ